MLRPNRHTLGLAGILLATFYAGLSQNNAAAYLLAFLLCSLFSVAAVHTWANLRGLRVVAEVIPAVFAGEPLAVTVRLGASSRRTHRALRLRGSGREWLVPQVSRASPADAALLLPSGDRGRHETIELWVESRYPLGFFTARRRFLLRQPHYVYPRPEGELPLPLDVPSPHESPSPIGAEGEDFAGVRDWRAGESMRHVDWKAVARGQRLMVKQWAGGGRVRFAFDFQALPELPLEARLRQLARWVVQAERRGAAYSLRLPGVSLPASQGDAQMHAALRRLAEVAA